MERAQKNNFAVAVFTPLTTAINITGTSVSPNKVLTGSPVLLSVTATSTAGAITNVKVNASSIGGASALPLVLSTGNVYTNSVTVGQIAGGKILPVTVRDDANNSLAGSLQVVVQTLADAQLDAYNAACPTFPNTVTLFTIATAPPENGVITPQTITNTTAFRCVRYVGPANSACNVAELQFFSPNPPPVPLAPRFTGGHLSGATLSLSASNGRAGGSWTLLQSTNLALPGSQWQTNIVGTFDGIGNLSTNIANTATNSQEFYVFKVQ